MTDLDDIDGVGPSYAEDLVDAGYESIDDVATADPDDVDGILSTMSGDELVENAQALADDAGSSGAVLADVSEDQENHLLRALVEQEVQARRTNNAEQVEVVRDAIATVKAGAPYELTDTQLDIAYRGVNQLESEYRSTRGIQGFVGDIHALANELNELRAVNR